jgi:hypothetical protein
MSRAEWTKIMYDGPGLYEWLKGQGIVIHSAALTPNLSRALGRWKNGERATEYLVDQLCCHLGFGSHLTFVPHELIVKGREFVDPDYTPPHLEGLEWDGRGAWVRKKAA